MKLNLTIVAVSILLGGCAGGSANVAQSFGAMGGAVAAASPVLTVLSITQTAYGIVTSGERQYQVSVRSTEMDQSSAVKQALNEACHVTFGSTVASELESNNGQLTRDQVISYSGCYVKDYKILSREREPNGELTLVVQANVSGNKLSNRLLGESSYDKPFDGQQHASRIQTYQQNMSESDRLVDAVLLDFPKRAYDVKVAKIQTKVKPNRTGFVQVDYLINVNADYKSSLKSLFDVVAKVPSGKILGSYVFGKYGVSNPVAEITVDGFMSQTTYQFSDQITYNKINQGLKKPQVLMVYAKHSGEYAHLNGGDWRWVNCYPALWNSNNPLYSLGAHGGKINRGKIWYSFQINFNNKSELDFLSSITELKLEVSDRACPKPGEN